ncbi:MAG TPA: right-handed parallel beta-helix repeat-containing protein, partial [Gammaproteobacteria bacterium]|nr:right-handed parallel beta-helix repeat-containing protein [Gammaproteobacteria bacterium]
QRFWCYDPSMGDADGAWTDLGQPPFNLDGGSIAPWNLAYDPDLDTVVTFMGTGGAGKVYVYNADSGNWNYVTDIQPRSYNDWSEVYSDYDPNSGYHIVYAGKQWQRINVQTGDVKPMAQLRDMIGVNDLETFSMEWAPELNKLLVAYNKGNGLHLYTYDPTTDTWANFQLKGQGPTDALAKWDVLARDPKTGVYVLLAKATTAADHPPATWTFTLSGDQAPASGSDSGSGSTGSGSGDTSGSGSSGSGTSGSGDSGSGTGTVGDSGGSGTAGSSDPGVCNADTCAGPDYQYASIQEAVNAAPDGGTVAIENGDYNQCFTINGSKNLTVQALNGRPHLHTKLCDQKSVIVNHSTGKVVLKGLEVSDTPSEKGIWFDGQDGTMILRNMQVHHGGMGVLAAQGTGRMEIHNSEIWDMTDPGENGHLIYAAKTKHLVVKGSYLHGAHDGHMIKAKAINVDIENNYLYNDFWTDTNLINIWGCGTNKVIGNAFLSDDKDHAVQAMDVTERNAYGVIQACPVDTATIDIAYNSFLKRGQKLWSSLFIDYYDMDSISIENNLVANARLMTDGNTYGSYWETGDYNGKNVSVTEADFLDDYLHVSSAPAAVSSENPPTAQYKHPTSTEPRDDTSTMGAYQPTNN